MRVTREVKQVGGSETTYRHSMLRCDDFFRGATGNWAPGRAMKFFTRPPGSRKMVLHTAGGRAPIDFGWYCGVVVVTVSDYAKIEAAPDI